MGYQLTLTIHSLLRWAVLGLLVYKLVRAFSAEGTWTENDRKTNIFLVVSMDLQLLLGLVLYFGMSPIVSYARQLGMKAAMKDPNARFFLVEHLALMVLAVILVHVGHVLIKKGADAASKHKSALIWFGISLLVVLVSIPWPFRKAAKPLFRFFNMAF